MRSLTEIVRRPIFVAAVLFLAGLLVRVLLWQAMPDDGLSYSAFYKGDAPLWMELARAAEGPDETLPTELRLPLRPPGMLFLVQALSGGQGAIFACRLLLVVLGALLAPLLFFGLRATMPGLPLRAAATAGGITAVSSAMLALSSSVNNEVPYLCLCLLSMTLWGRLRSGSGYGSLVTWSILHGIACLVRVEHALLFVLLVGWLQLGWWRAGRRGGAIRALVAVATFALTLLPWQIEASGQVSRFNEQPAPALPMPGSLRWDADALAAAGQLPPFLRGSAFRLIDLTVRHRGGNRVGLADVRILEEACGYHPQPLSPWFLVALYGPLNFHLANREGVSGGFDKSALDAPPPLVGGADRYPSLWLRSLPSDGQLAMEYPFHLQKVNCGYALGWNWILEHPGDAARLWWTKLLYFWQGAAMGVTSYGLPIGTSGVRRKVDLLVANGTWPGLFRALLLAACVGGLLLTRYRDGLAPWLLLAASKAIVCVLFFGYARHGAVVVPVVALCVALLLERCLWQPLLLRRPELASRLPWLGSILLVVAVAVEGFRCASGIEVTIDGQRFEASDPFPPLAYADRRVEIR